MLVSVQAWDILSGCHCLPQLMSQALKIYSENAKEGTSGDY